MTRRTWPFSWLLLLVATHPLPAQRFVALGMPDSAVLNAIRKADRAILAGDRATVAGMVRYPLRLNNGPDEHVTFASRAALLARYDAVFTPDVRQAIAADKLDDILGSKDGVPLGKGMVWMTSTCVATHPRRCSIAISAVNHRKK